MLFIQLFAIVSSALFSSLGTFFQGYNGLFHSSIAAVDLSPTRTIHAPPNTIYTDPPDPVTTAAAQPPVMLSFPSATASTTPTPLAPPVFDYTPNLIAAAPAHAASSSSPSNPGIVPEDARDDVPTSSELVDIHAPPRSRPPRLSDIGSHVHVHFRTFFLGIFGRIKVSFTTRFRLATLPNPRRLVGQFPAGLPSPSNAVRDAIGLARTTSEGWIRSFEVRRASRRTRTLDNPIADDRRNSPKHSGNNTLPPQLVNGPAHLPRHDYTRTCHPGPATFDPVHNIRRVVDIEGQQCISRTDAEHTMYTTGKPIDAAINMRLRRHTTRRLPANTHLSPRCAIMILAIGRGIFAHTIASLLLALDQKHGWWSMARERYRAQPYSVSRLGALVGLCVAPFQLLLLWLQQTWLNRVRSPFCRRPISTAFIDHWSRRSGRPVHHTTELFLPLYDRITRTGPFNHSLNYVIFPSTTQLDRTLANVDHYDALANLTGTCCASWLGDSNTNADYRDVSDDKVLLTFDVDVEPTDPSVLSCTHNQHLPEQKVSAIILPPTMSIQATSPAPSPPSAPPLGSSFDLNPLRGPSQSFREVVRHRRRHIDKHTSSPPSPSPVRPRPITVSASSNRFALLAGDCT
ncbi:hypothetical protein OF83DRAFT_295758 [Amylostereum chailletii]|nr:hypothetical protein OF83DRAFT_295758 [Amylostereum chailletii]